MHAAKPRIAIPQPTSADLHYNGRSWKQYADAVAEAGGEPLLLEISGDLAGVRALAATCDGICLPGSPADVDPTRFGAERDPACAPADPAREAVDYLLLDHAAAAHKPVLGICFGMQSMNTWSGGTLVQDLHTLPVNHSAGASVAIAHTVLVSPASQLASLLADTEAPVQDDFRRLPVNSSHHQAVGVVGDELRVVARCPDDGVVEAIEQDESDNARVDRPSWLVGVQWHPERSTALSAASRALFRELIRKAAEAQLRRSGR